MGGSKAMKQMRRMNGQENLFEAINTRKQAEREAKKMADEELFTVNVDKTGLGKKRQKLSADRFKEKDRSLAKSKTEQAILKKLRQKNPSIYKKEVNELVDLWETPVVEKSKHENEYDVFAKQQMNKVRAVMLPEEGQSFNPSATAHTMTLRKIMDREAADIEFKRTKSLSGQIQAAKQERANQSPNESEEEEVESKNEYESEDDDEDSNSDAGSEVPQKAVDREKKLTVTQRNKRQAGIDKKIEEIAAKKQRKMIRQYEAIPAFVALDKKDTLLQKQRDDLKIKETADEKEAQETIGFVTKPAHTGRFKYKMRKADFQLEDELAPSLREHKPTGMASMLREKQDDFFRRGQIELDAPTIGEKKRQRKQQYKIKVRQGGVYGTMAQKLDKKNKKRKQQNDDEDDRAMMLENDMIFI